MLKIFKLQALWATVGDLLPEIWQNCPRLNWAVDYHSERCVTVVMPKGGCSSFCSHLSDTQWSDFIEMLTPLCSPPPVAQQESQGRGCLHIALYPRRLSGARSSGSGSGEEGGFHSLEQSASQSASHSECTWDRKGVKEWIGSFVVAQFVISIFILFFGYLLWAESGQLPRLFVFVFCEIKRNW